MPLLTLYGVTWHAISPSRLELAGYPCALVYNGWQWEIEAFGNNIPVLDRDHGAHVLARAMSIPQTEGNAS